MRQSAAYIIPGFDREDDRAGYQAIAHAFEKKRIASTVLNVSWKQRTVTSFVSQVKNRIAPARSLFLVGFSLGAMAACVAATTLNIKQLFLCSLSPYFREDLSHLTQEDLDTLGPRRIADFQKHSFPEIAARITCKTLIFAGSNESSVLIKRCEVAANEIRPARLLRIRGAAHEISDPRYRNVLTKAISELPY